MSSDKTKAEQAAEEWEEDVVREWTERNCEGLLPSRAESFLAGRTHFIEHELRGLLMQAREYRHTIDELIEKARKA